MSEINKIKCCLCGILIAPNDAFMCVDCLRSQVDITSKIATTSELVQCRKCERWHIKQDQWLHHEIESVGLLAVCLKKIPGLTKDTKVIDASWIWTEPHCKRLKINLDVEQGVLDDKVKLRQKTIVEFTIRHKQCMECIREATDHTWGVCVQIRHRVGHKKALYQLESLLTKRGLHNLLLDVSIVGEGLDLYFKSNKQSDKVVQFVTTNMPTRSKASRKLVSQDKQSNTTKYEYTIQLEIASLCKNDLVYVSKTLGYGYTGFMLVTKLSSSIHMISPLTLQPLDLNATRYFSKPPSLVLNFTAMINFVVLDIEPVCQASGGGGGGGNDLDSVSNGGRLLAEAEVVRESDLGENDNSYRILTHLGHILKVGDSVAGYDLSRMCGIDDSLAAHLGSLSQDIILVRKVEEKKTNASKKAGMRRKGGRDANVLKNATVFTMNADTIDGENDNQEEDEEFFDVEDDDGDGNADEWNDDNADNEDDDDDGSGIHTEEGEEIH